MSSTIALGANPFLVAAADEDALFGFLDDQCIERIHTL
jgi:hypothetical protein